MAENGIIEFLSVYGWALIIVIVAIGALAYFKVLSPEKFIPETCARRGYQYQVTANDYVYCFNDSMAQQNIIVADVFYKNFTRVEEWN